MENPIDESCGRPYVEGMTETESLAAAINEEVDIAVYDPLWPARFEAEKARLATVVPGSFLEVQHIGSTAVPGLSAKPIVDILAGIGSMEEAPAIATSLLGVGYTTSASFNDSLVDRKWFMRWKDGHRTHHLHVVVHGEVWTKRLAFRDALRADPALASRYAALKSDLASAHRTDREAYTEAKGAFVEAILSG